MICINLKLLVRTLTSYLLKLIRFAPNFLFGKVGIRFLLAAFCILVKKVSMSLIQVSEILQHLLLLEVRIILQLGTSRFLK